MFFSALSTRHSCLFSLDQPTSPGEHLRRDRQADLLRGLEINHQLNFVPAAPVPERLHENRATGSSACIQETYAEDFPCLLRVGERRGCQKSSQ